MRKKDDLRPIISATVAVVICSLFVIFSYDEDQIRSSPKFSLVMGMVMSGYLSVFCHFLICECFPDE